MTKAFSVWLDLLRVAATLIVVLSHLAYPRFTRGDYQWMRDLNLGSDAVILFFVISGLVIARAAQRDVTLGVYAFNRTTRLYSVMLPALLLTWAFDGVGLWLEPSAYPTQFYEDWPLGVILLRGLTFSNEWWLASPLRLGTNGPLWSLSYEAAYYLIFGAALFLQGPRRWAILVALLLLVGPLPLLLMPSWIMGVGLWFWLSTGPAFKLTRTTALALAGAGPLFYALALALNVPDCLASWLASLAPEVNFRALLRFSDEFLWNGLIGILVGLHLIGMAILLKDGPTVSARLIQWLAGASFSIYVTHYPALHLLHASLPSHMPLRDLSLLLGALAVGLIFAEAFERPLPWIRRRLAALIAPLR